jgi:hypothetical protein
MKVKFNASEIESAVRKLSSYVKHGNAYIMEIKKAVKHRSLPQNKYYWGVVITLFSQSTGYSADEAHQTLAGIHLKYEKDGKWFAKSTTKLNTLEFETYLEQCRVFMWHELNVHVPLPNELSDEFLITLDNIYNY